MLDAVRRIYPVTQFYGPDEATVLVGSRVEFPLLQSPLYSEYILQQLPRSASLDSDAVHSHFADTTTSPASRLAAIIDWMRGLAFTTICGSRC